MINDWRWRRRLINLLNSHDFMKPVRFSGSIRFREFERKDSEADALYWKKLRMAFMHGQLFGKGVRKGEAVRIFRLKLNIREKINSFVCFFFFVSIYLDRRLDAKRSKWQIWFYCWTRWKWMNFFYRILFYFFSKCNKSILSRIQFEFFLIVRFYLISVLNWWVLWIKE